MTLSLAVFAKAAILGQTKTRLQPTLGRAGALQAHCQLVEYTLQQIGAVSQIRTELWVSAEHPSAIAWSERFAIPLRLQQGADLGARMDHALRQQLSAGASFAFVMGCDCPSLDADYLGWAADNCATADVLVAPAEDGGYGMIGVSRPQPELFIDMPWGSNEVCAETRRRCECLGLHLIAGAPIWDVDHAADWQRFQDLRSGNTV